MVLKTDERSLLVYPDPSLYEDEDEVSYLIRFDRSRLATLASSSKSSTLLLLLLGLEHEETKLEPEQEELRAVVVLLIVVVDMLLRQLFVLVTVGPLRCLHSHDEAEQELFSIDDELVQLLEEEHDEDGEHSEVPERLAPYRVAPLAP